MFKPAARIATRAIPSKLFRPRIPQPLSIRLRPSRRYVSDRPPPNRPEWRQRVVHYRFNPDEVARAKPFVNTENLGRAAGSRGAYFFYALCCGSAGVFYFTHLETVPISGRRRFMYFSDNAVADEGQRFYKELLEQNSRSLLPPSDRRVKQVQRVMARLIPSTGLDNVDWGIHVIDSPEANAFVIPGGKVFVYTGILPIAENDDGLAAILGHEIAHNLARHQAEAMSSNIWLILPLRFGIPLAELLFFGTTGLLKPIGDMVLEYGLAKPASRKQETEADHIGLILMAKSCYNPSAAVGVWSRMQLHAENEPPQWMSTHPANATRMEALRALLPKAQIAQDASDCSQMIQYSRNFGAAMQTYAPPYNQRAPSVEKGYDPFGIFK